MNHKTLTADALRFTTAIKTNSSYKTKDDKNKTKAIET